MAWLTHCLDLLALADLERAGHRSGVRVDDLRTLRHVHGLLPMDQSGVLPVGLHRLTDHPDTRQLGRVVDAALFDGVAIPLVGVWM